MNIMLEHEGWKRDGSEESEAISLPCQQRSLISGVKLPPPQFQFRLLFPPNLLYTLLLYGVQGRLLELHQSILPIPSFTILVTMEIAI